MLKNTLLGALALLVAIFTGLILILPTPTALDTESATDNDTLLITNARLFDGRAVLDNVDVLVEGLSLIHI